MSIALLTLVCLFTAPNIRGLNLIEDTIAAGYGIQNHKVTTEDGYILTMHRIPYSKAEAKEEQPKKQKIVVLLMHRMMETSASFFNQGPRSKIAFTLAHSGYDVWLGNARGSPFSRAHETLNPDDDMDKLGFFNFSWEEIGIFDIPAMVDYILNVTQVKQISFIGDAEGATSFLILNSLKPEYNKKFLTAQLLDPVGYTKHFPSAELKAAASSVDSLYALGQAAGIVEVSSWNMNNQPDGAPTPHRALQSIVSFVANLGGLAPVGTSLKQLAHYAQNIRDSSFCRWDYGDKTNREIYGSKDPPPYNLQKVSAYTTLYYRKGHTLVNELDILAMADHMPNARTVKVDDDNFSPKDLVEYTRSGPGR